MCNHCYKVHYPKYNEAEACDLAHAQRRKYEEDILRAEQKPTLKAKVLGPKMVEFLNRRR